ncbi:MAG: hypothetical protein KGJ69_16715, partial [Thermoplasmata archaeon]|nr:hypothetical protein [Thermoplasmata archaeon]
STAEFYKQLKEAGVPDEKAVELTKAFMERAGPSSPLGAIFGNIGPDLKDLGPLFEKTARGPRTITVRVGDVDKDEETSTAGKTP